MFCTKQKKCQEWNCDFKTPLICIDSIFYCWYICVFRERIFKVLKCSEKNVPGKCKYLSNGKCYRYKSGVFWKWNFISDISSVFVQNPKMPPYALKTALKLLRFYTKILQKINYIFYSPNFNENVCIVSHLLGTLYVYKIAKAHPQLRICSKKKTPSR